MKPSHLTINTSPPPRLPHYTATGTTSNTTSTSTTTTTTPRSHRRKTILTILTLATLSTLSILYLHDPSTTYLPHITATRTTSRTFIPNTSYNDLSPAADGNWTALLPPNGGFFSKQVGGKGEYEMVGVTMFHQLHCLSMIRGALQSQQREMDGLVEEGEGGAGADRRRSRDGVEDLFGVRRKRNVDSGDDLFGVRRKRNVNSEEDISGVRRKRSEESHSGAPKHYLHCFDYLVQTILCNADATVEPAHETEDGRRAVDGYDVQHQCKNADAVWATVMGDDSVPGWKLNTETEDARESDYDMGRRYS
ncbi:hypothetical protein FKW77_007739 [Venturia effusa]|uniref:Uncharacterized protein n=1 Tax=Venturia effusa TaxID=50376 RepID=A0A517L5W7_9PEZI|nr:hypothetical protein FKW77_007739 [Venturia effusa]